MQSLANAWNSNPEQAKLKRELPFIAEILEACAKHVPVKTKVPQVTKEQERRKRKAIPRHIREEGIRNRKKIAAQLAEQKRIRDQETGRYVPKAVEG